jgi:hypothetical protein
MNCHKNYISSDSCLHFLFLGSFFSFVASTKKKSNEEKAIKVYEEEI